MVRIKSPQDFGAAVVFVLIGAAGFYFGWDLRTGSAARMGPGYFPMVLSGCIIAIGLVVGFRSFVLNGPRIERFRIRPIGLLVVAALIFGYLIEEIGLAIAGALMILVATYAGREAKLKEAIILAIVLTTFSIVVFVWALGQSLPVWSGR
jgi:hypothetical protein